MFKMLPIIATALIAFAPNAIANPQSRNAQDRELAIVAIALANKKDTVENTVKALRTALPNESETYLRQIAQYIHSKT